MRGKSRFNKTLVTKASSPKRIHKSPTAFSARKRTLKPIPIKKGQTITEVRLGKEISRARRSIESIIEDTKGRRSKMR